MKVITKAFVIGLLFICIKVSGHPGKIVEIVSVEPQSLVKADGTVVIQYGVAMTRQLDSWHEEDSSRLYVPEYCGKLRVGFSVLFGNNGGTVTRFRVIKNEDISPLGRVGLPSFDWRRSTASAFESHRTVQSRWLTAEHGDFFEVHGKTDSDIPIQIAAGWTLFWIECSGSVFRDGFEIGNTSRW